MERLRRLEAHVGSPVWEVGGCVRDAYMGIEPKDYDYVCMETPDVLLRRGWTPTGKLFPVFRHPEFPNVELALGRTERKVAAGHNGFEWGLAKTLTEDLMRRDFTMNAMARNSKGDIIDPFMGKEDIDCMLLREVNAQYWADDPLRVFRAARFAARYTFDPVPSLLRCMRNAAPELPSLDFNRVREEMMKALGYTYSHLFFDTLRMGNCLDYWFPELLKLVDIPAGFPKHHPEKDTWEHTMLALLACHDYNGSVEAKLLALVHDFGKGETPKDELPHHYAHENRVDGVRAFAQRFGFSENMERKMVTHVKNHLRHHMARKMRPVKLVNMYKQVKRFQEDFLIACKADEMGKPNAVDTKDTYVRDLFFQLNRVKFPENCGEQKATQLLEKAAHEFKKGQ